VRPERVSQAVVRASEGRFAERILNAVPVRPLLALRAVFPGAAMALLWRTGIIARIRRFVDSQSNRETDGGTGTET
jgi:hypothetical protein